MTTRFRNATRLALVSSGAGLAAIIFAVRSGALEARPWLVAAVGGVAALAAAGALACAVQRLVAEGGRRAAAAGEAAAMAGLLVIIGVGFANWLFDYRGLLLLTEGEQVLLGPERHLRDVTAGPLGRVGGLSGTLELAKVELRPSPDGGFVPASRLLLATDAPARRREIVVAPGQPGRGSGAIFQQGAFGFVPRIIVQRRGKTLFDQPVQLESRRDDARGISFEASIPLQDQQAELKLAVDLSRLDERMKGHPVLGVALRRGEETIGAGELLPGHGATMKDGWQVGFGGMKMWSEIDLRRHDFHVAALLGLLTTAVGLCVWVVARWRSA
ncbi:hypothetical protein [Anaeromyxobacter oryzisoli]|uniref:hypothetical protein n=1 Tax=Anaeromyxobacter oryzisoli TaxID=2925408 RepID=UPI001F583E3B|nr:hypothetical protein [Anaeromyxobacter sp. SG63]